VMRHPTTIHLCIMPVDSNLKEVADRERRRLRKVHSKLSNGFQTVGMFDFVMKTADRI